MTAVGDDASRDADDETLSDNDRNDGVEDNAAQRDDERTHEFVVAADSPRRLDAFLGALLPETSRSALKRHIEDGCVTVDGDVVRKGSTQAKPGQQIRIELPPPPPFFPLPEDIPLDVLHDDEAILVIDKPAGMVVHPSPGVDPSGTLVNALLAGTGSLSTEGGEFRPGIVHRLDRETSGVMVIARTDAAHRTVAAQFKSRTVSKTYLALSHGSPRESSGEVDLAIGRSLANRKKMAIRTDEQAKPSKTHWRTVRHIGDCTWFECKPVTGRTHQIRLHLKAIGHPILCDALYGREKKLKLSSLLPKSTELPADDDIELARHALHAHQLTIDHPTTGERMTFTALLTDDLQPFWDHAEPHSD